jgi:predicted nucleic acid-binding protein
MIDLLLTEKNMHQGESEVIAQTRQLGISEFSEDSLCAVIDEKTARSIANRMSIRIIGTLRVLALFHILFGIIDYNSSVKQLQESGARLSDSLDRNTFQKIEAEINSGKPEMIDRIEGKK